MFCSTVPSGSTARASEVSVTVLVICFPYLESLEPAESNSSAVMSNKACGQSVFIISITLRYGASYRISPGSNVIRARARN